MSDIRTKEDNCFGSLLAAPAMADLQHRHIDEHIEGRRARAHPPAPRRARPCRRAMSHRHPIGIAARELLLPAPVRCARLLHND